MQQDRLRNPHPWTYEIPLAIVLTLVLIAVLGVHTGRAVANLLAGGGWGWPPATELLRSLPGLWRGDAGAGLTNPGVVADPRRRPGRLLNSSVAGGQPQPPPARRLPTARPVCTPSTATSIRVTAIARGIS